MPGSLNKNDPHDDPDDDDGDRDGARRSGQDHQRVVLGEICGAHGVRGEVRVRVAVDSPDPLFSITSAWIGEGVSDPEARRFDVLGCSPARAGDLKMRLAGIETREAVAGVLGRLVMAPASVLPVLPDGEFYGFELMGFRVESEAGEELGTVRDIWETGAHDVLLVEDEDGVRRLIPTAAALVREIRRSEQRIIVVDLPGLFEPC